MGEFESRVLKVGLMQPGQSIFSENVYTVEIDDEAAGEYVVVRQVNHDGPEERLSIDPRHWPALRAEIDRMVAECRKS
jgi:predicted lysophospholipase L1 biosynthesis ABC-type transport system permease subunit